MNSQLSFNDNLALTKTTRKLTKEGYLQGVAALTRVGVQKYQLSNFTGLDSDTNKLVGVFRPPETVFSDETIDSAKLKPITMTHPHEMVDADNYRNYSVGSIGENVYKLDDERLGSTIQITNKAIIDDIQNGKIKEVSMGYTANVKQQTGEYKGEQYEYVFDGAMSINHCAIVNAGRCGETVSILDNKEEQLGMNIEEIKEKIINDEDFKQKLKELLKDSNHEESDKSNNSDNDITEDDKQVHQDSNSENEEKNQEKAIQDAVAVRLSIIDKARYILKDQDFSNMSNRQILDKALEGSVKNADGKSDEYLLGLLDGVVDKHNKAKEQHKIISDSSTNVSNHAKYYSASEIQKL